MCIDPRGSRKSAGSLPPFFDSFGVSSCVEGFRSLADKVAVEVKRNRFRGTAVGSQFLQPPARSVTLAASHVADHDASKYFWASCARFGYLFQVGDALVFFSIIQEQAE